MSLIDVQDLSVYFRTDSGRVHAVNGVSFSIESGETLGLVGESGSGKSVIGLSILRLLPKNARASGNIIFKGRDLLDMGGGEFSGIRGRTLSYVPQNPAASLNPLMKNGRQISEVFEARGEERRSARSRALNVLDRLMLRPPEEVAGKYCHQLSGGMRQRLVAGIALSLDPEIVVADEPTKGLDSVTREKTVDLFWSIKEDSRRSMLLITHDLDLAARICNRVAVLYAGEIVEMGPAGAVLETPCHPYTRGLIGSLPRNGLRPLEGYSPSMIDLPGGCFFRDRCERRGPRCGTDHPGLCTSGGRMLRCHSPS